MESRLRFESRKKMARLSIQRSFRPFCEGVLIYRKILDSQNDIISNVSSQETGQTTFLQYKIKIGNTTKYSVSVSGNRITAQWFQVLLLVR